MKFKCEKGKDGLNYIDVFVKLGTEKYTFNTLVRTGSEFSIFSAQKLGIDISGMSSVETTIGFETIKVYPTFINSIAIGDNYEGKLYGVNQIYVSELDYFKNAPLLGMDILSHMDITNKIDSGMTIEFDDEIGHEIREENRKEYLEKLTREQITVNLTDFFFIEDGIYPSEFELLLVVCKDGTLSAGCPSYEPDYMKEDPRGIIRQGRGGIIYYDDIVAWKPLEGYKI